MRIDYDPDSNVFFVAEDSAGAESHTTGDVLRAVHTEKPKGLLVTISPEHLEEPVALIAQLHRRCPRMPLIALTARHDDRTERAAREAGAAYYFPLAGEADRTQLYEALAALGIGCHTTGGPAPPPRPRRSRASPSRDAPSRDAPSRDAPRRAFRR